MTWHDVLEVAIGVFVTRAWMFLTGYRKTKDKK